MKKRLSLHETITFDEFIMPALRFDIKVFRKRLAKRVCRKENIKRMKEIKRKIDIIPLFR